MVAAKRPWSVEKKSTNVHRIDYCAVGTTSEQRMLWLADVHWDNPKCDRVALKRHLDEAVELDAPVVIAGDFFCAMQGKYDKRSNKADVRPEHQRGDYLDSLVDTAAEWLKPYARNIAILGYGNHETKIRDVHETDLLDRLAYKLRSAGGITTTGGYDGWVRLACSRVSKIARQATTMCTGYYHHGWGGGGPVTKGLIDFNRLSEQVVADFFVLGHIHRSTYVDHAIKTLNNSCIEDVECREYVRLSTYKHEAVGGHGWAIERGMGPRPIGGRWLHFGIRRDRNSGVDISRIWRRWIGTS